MKIETTVGEIDEFLYKYSELLGWAGGVEFQEDDDVRLGIANYRVQVPSLGVSLRFGDLMSQAGGRYYEYHNFETGEHVVEHTPPPEDAEWKVDASITLICGLDETDPTKYIMWSTDGAQGTLYDYFYEKFKEYSDVDKVPCFVDTTDFMEDEAKAVMYAQECEKNYEEE